MAPSAGVTNTLGAIGGGVLAACLAPQLWKLWVTRSARDLSYLFLALYTLGLTLSFVYLYYEDALVAWVCILVEIAFGLAMISAKFYLDNYGPHSARSAKRARPQAKLTNSPSLAREIRIEVQDFAAGKAAPFPLLRPAPSHAAQHLLIDARLALPAAARGSPKAKAANGSPRRRSQDSETKGSAGSGSGSPRSAAAGLKAAGSGAGGGGVLHEVAEMLEAALASAGLPVQRPQAASFPSFRRRPSQAAAEGGWEEGGEVQEAPDLLYYSCGDGYAIAILFRAAATLSLDFLAASDAAVLRMGEAAQQMCEQLVQQWPGTRVAASSLARLPRA